MTIDRFLGSAFLPPLYRTLPRVIITFLLMVVSPVVSSGQVLSPLAAPSCGMQSAPQHALFKGIAPHGGAHLPTRGALRGLVVFVETLNDTSPDLSWPLGTMPSWSAAYKDRVERYFADMSGGAMQLQLDVYPDLMITRGTEDGYVYWSQNFGHAINEILDSIDTKLDFGIYDLWDAEGKVYRLQPGPDGRVDLLIFIFRSIANTTFLPFSGVSDLGFAGYHFLDGSLARWVYGGTGQFNDAGASGLTICRAPGYRMVIDQEFAFQVTLHELGHKLFGEGHPAEIFGGLGLMANAGNGYAMNGFERQLAGYIDFREVAADQDTVVTLRDYVTTGEAVLIPIPEVDRAYYSLEYHTRQSEWDSAPVEGLYAFRIYDSWSKNQKEVHVVSAEGKYNWALDTISGTIYPTTPSPLKGYNRFQRIPINGKNYWAEGWWGDSRCAFTLDRPEFAVLKNPTPDFLFGTDTIRTNLHISLLTADESSATVRISYQSPVILSTGSSPASAFSLSLPYPHPLRDHGSGVIPFTTSRGGPVRLNLYDATGRMLRTLLEKEVPAGSQKCSINVDGLPAGVYQLVLQSAEGRSTQSIVITR